MADLLNFLKEAGRPVATEGCTATGSGGSGGSERAETAETARAAASELRELPHGALMSTDAALLYDYALAKHEHCLQHCVKKINHQLAHIEQCLKKKETHEKNLIDRMQKLKAKHMKFPHVKLFLALKKLTVLDLLKCQSKQRFLESLSSALQVERQDLSRQLSLIPSCRGGEK
jgi:hypothetical protein